MIIKLCHDRFYDIGEKWPFFKYHFVLSAINLGNVIKLRFGTEFYTGAEIGNTLKITVQLFQQRQHQFYYIYLKPIYILN